MRSTRSSSTFSTRLGGNLPGEQRYRPATEHCTTHGVSSWCFEGFAALKWPQRVCRDTGAQLCILIQEQYM